ncbi:MAG: pyridoxamine 5'-phosphate oxidase family protein [Candidatus Omnitrophota bacterium]
MEEDIAIEVVREVLNAQNLGVLATFGEKYPYTSLVGFVMGENERTIIFTTLRNTRKYLYLTRRPEVSILISTGTNHPSDFQKSSAVTAFGEAREAAPSEKDGFKALFLKKFPFLEDFTLNAGCAFIKVDIKKYLVVTRFQKVREIVLE